MWRTSWFIILIFLLQGICMSSGNISFLRLSKWFPFPYSSKNHPVGNAQTPQLKNPIYRPLCGIWSALNPKKVHTKAFSILRSPLRSPQQQLSTTPLFYIASTKGSSYLQDDVQSGQSDRKAIVYFMSSEDANDFLDELSQSSPMAMNELRLSTTTFETVLGQMQKRKQSKIYGRQPVDLVLRIQPSSHQFRNAQKLLGGSNYFTKSKSMIGMTIPMFAVDGLMLKRNNGEMLNPFYFAYEDLIEDWRYLREKNQDPNLPKELQVRVVDLTKVLCLADSMQRNGNMNTKNILTLQNPGIVPPRREIDMLRKYYRNEVPVKNEFARAKMFK